MTTQRDLDNAARVQLNICDKCGWYATHYHAERCNPARGQIAVNLIAAVPDVVAGQLGYGDNCVAFELTPDTTVVFEAGAGKRPFLIRHVWLHGGLSLDDAATLVRALETWADGVAAKRHIGDG